jgi:hypothetical protein
VLGGSATALVKGNGTLLSGAGFVKGDATLDNTIYPTLTAETNLTTTFISGGGASASITIIIRKITNGTNSIIHLFLPQIMWTTGATGGTAISNLAIPIGLRPANFAGAAGYHLSPAIIKIGTGNVMGVVWIQPDGKIILSPDIAMNLNSVPANTNYGLANQHTITYIGA